MHQGLKSKYDRNSLASRWIGFWGVGEGKEFSRQRSRCLRSALSASRKASSLISPASLSSSHASGDRFRMRDNTPLEPLRQSIGDPCLCYAKRRLPWLLTCNNSGCFAHEYAGVHVTFNNRLAQPQCQPFMTFDLWISGINLSHRSNGGNSIEYEIGVTGKPHSDKFPFPLASASSDIILLQQWRTWYWESISYTKLQKISPNLSQSSRRLQIQLDFYSCFLRGNGASS